MTSWSVQPAEVLRILSEVQSRQGELAAAASRGATAYETFLSGAGDILAPAAEALGTALRDQAPMMQRAISRITACTVGASQSTSAYVEGDEQMAQRTATAALAAAESGDLSTLRG